MKDRLHTERVSRRIVGAALVAAVCLAALVAALLLFPADHSQPDSDRPHVVNLGHVCGKKQPDVVVTMRPGQKSTMVDCLGGGR